ncbi:O-antigen ligase family protein [Archangium gephyra]|uniref:O-antigen ligase family protein n=1 Tax=Archangium gephyra TaxID=48 RepID=UPI0014710DD8|nr:O-antigen ligase family protein [Archangium gephyra]
MFATLLGVLPSAWLGTERFTCPKNVLFHAAALATAVACLAWGRRWTLDAVDLSLGVFAGLSLLSALAVAANPWLTLVSTGVTLSGSMLFLCTRPLAENGRREAILLAVVLVAGLLALTVLLEAYGPLKGLSTRRAPGGTLGHRNRAAHLLVLSLPVTWLCLTRARRRPMLAVLLACAMLTGAAVTLTRSRAAWLALLVLGLGMGVAWGLAWHAADATRRRRTAGFIVALLGGVGVALVMPNTLEWRGSYGDSLRRIGEYEAGSGQGRLVQYGNTLRMIVDAPLLGVGPGNWPVHYPRYTTRGDPSYNVDAVVPVGSVPQSDWMGFLAERGLPAMLALALVAGLLLAESWKRARNEAGPEWGSEALALTAVLAGLLVMGGVDTVLLTTEGMFFVAVMVGALARAQREQVVIVPGVARRRAAMVLVVLLTGGPLVYGAVRGWARHLVFLEPQTAERLERASRLDPGGSEARLFLGSMKARAGQCEEARAILREARNLFPYSEAPLKIWSQCARSRRDLAREAPLPVQ